MNIVDNKDWYELSLDEKIQTVISILNSPIYRRRINDEGLSKAILDIYDNLYKKE